MQTMRFTNVTEVQWAAAAPLCFTVGKLIELSDRVRPWGIADLRNLLAENSAALKGKVAGI